MSTTTTQDGRTAIAGPVTPDVPAELRRDLLDIARAAIQVAVGLASGWSLASRIRHAHRSDLRSAVFVTLTDAGELRGCMGTLDPGQPVAQAVAAAAMTATLDDPRFYPVEADELADLEGAGWASSSPRWRRTTAGTANGCWEPCVGRLGFHRTLGASPRPVASSSE